MGAAVLVPCLVRLRGEFNDLAPDRATGSDGWIGDTAHQQEVSDHNPDETGSVPIHDADRVNEVHAVDVTADLRYPNLSMEMVIQFLLGRCRSGAENRLRYMIYNRRIWEASNGWRQRAYTGASPHIEHAHFSASYDTAREASTVSWRLEDIPIMMTDADRAFIKAENDRVIKAVNAVAETVVDRMITDYSGTEETQSLYDWTAKTNVRHNAVMAAIADVRAAVGPPLGLAPLSQVPKA
jgi:hypothetical protein